MTDRIFLELESLHDGAQVYFRARVQISDALKIGMNNGALSDKVAEIENSYRNTILKCRDLYQKVRTSRRADRLFRYWDIADIVTRFLNQTHQKGFFLNYPKEHFARDLKVTTRTIDYLLSFRRKVADKKQLDLTKPWSYYVQNYYRMKKDRNINL